MACNLQQREEQRCSDRGIVHTCTFQETWAGRKEANLVVILRHMSWKEDRLYGLSHCWMAAR